MIPDAARRLNEYQGLNFGPKEWGKAFEELRHDEDLGPDFNGQLREDGSYEDLSGNYIGNITDYLR